jgi:hypothetical protein
MVDFIGRSIGSDGSRGRYAFWFSGLLGRQACRAINVFAAIAGKTAMKQR